MENQESVFANLPRLLKTDANKYYSNRSERDTCYWSNNCDLEEEQINEFIKKANKYNYSEDQSLAVLSYNNFDIEKSECDLKIYRPLKGLSKLPVKCVVKLISESISRNLKSREHRNFEDVLLMFPGYTIGDVLQCYSQNRFQIKKHTYKVKKQLRRKVTKPIRINNNSTQNLTNQNIPFGNSTNNITGSSSSNQIECLDSQFRLVYQRHFDWIVNSNQLDQIIDKDLGVIKQHSNFQSNFVDLSNQIAYNSGLVNDPLDTRNIHRSLDGLLSTLDNESDVALLNILRKLNKHKLKYSSGATSAHNGCCNFDVAKLASLLDTNQLEAQSNRLDQQFDSLEERFVQFVKQGSTKQINQTNPEDVVEDELSFQLLCDRHEQVLEEFKHLLPEPSEFPKHKHTWSNMDFSLFLLGLAKFGCDFLKISDSILTKSETMVRAFYMQFKEIFNLEKIAGINLLTSTYEQLTIQMTNTITCPPTAYEITGPIKTPFIPSPLCPLVESPKKPVEIVCVKVEPEIKIEMSLNKASSSHTSETSQNSIFVPIQRVLRNRQANNERYQMIIAEERKSRNRKPTKRSNTTNNNHNHNNQRKHNSVTNNNICVKQEPVKRRR